MASKKMVFKNGTITSKKTYNEIYVKLKKQQNR